MPVAITGFLTTFRQAVQAELAADVGFEFRAGIIEGPVADRDIGCVWVDLFAEDEAGVDVASISFHVRALKMWKQEPAMSALEEHVAALEDLAERIPTALRDRAANVPGTWMFRVTEVAIDYETFAVEASVLAFTANPFGGGA